MRAEQRRALRLIPTHVFAEHAPTVGPDVTHIADVDRPLIETSLRAEAKTLIGTHSSLLEAWRQHAHAEILDDFYERNRTRAEQMDASRQTAFRDELDKARATRQAADRPSPRIEDPPALRRLLFLLVWADGLSGYRDPRVDRSRAADGAETELLAPEDLA